MAASLSDILTSAQNLVSAINSIPATYLGARGNQVANAITAATVVATGQGRVGSLSTIVSATGGFLYDSAVTSSTTKPICAIPAGAAITVVDMPFNLGLLVVPGSGGSVTVSYATGASVGS